MPLDKVKIGIIGGSGLDDPQILENRREFVVDTQFGKPSDALISGTIRGVECVLLARHGRQHAITPSNVNYRANLCALKDAGCTHVLATTLGGSLKEEIRPGDFVLLDQYYDKTFRRQNTFYDGSAPSFRGVYHVMMNEPYCGEMRKLLEATCKKLGYRYHPRGTVVTVEGPRFSTRAESLVHRQLGFDIVGMTAATECALANELALCYASLAIATDYDCWHEEEAASSEGAQPVSCSLVEECAREAVPRALRVVEETVVAIGELGAAYWEKEVENRCAAVKQSRFDRLPDTQ